MKQDWAEGLAGSLLRGMGVIEVDQTQRVGCMRRAEDGGALTKAEGMSAVGRRPVSCMRDRITEVETQDRAQLRSVLPAKPRHSGEISKTSNDEDDELIYSHDANMTLF